MSDDGRFTVSTATETRADVWSWAEALRTVCRRVVPPPALRRGARRRPCSGRLRTRAPSRPFVACCGEGGHDGQISHGGRLQLQQLRQLLPPLLCLLRSLAALYRRSAASARACGEQALLARPALAVRGTRLCEPKPSDRRALCASASRLSDESHQSP